MKRRARGTRPGPRSSKKQEGEPTRVQPSRRARKTRSRLRSRPDPDEKTSRQLVGRGDLELVVAAVLGPLVRPPAEEDRGVAEPVALKVVVLHLAHPLDPERLPGEILPRAPAALGAGLPARRVRVRLRPVAPGMTLERGLPERRQLLGQLSAPRHRERRRHPDMLEHPAHRRRVPAAASRPRPFRSCASETPRRRSRRCGRASP